MSPTKELNLIRQRRQRRVRAKVFGTSSRPRLAVFRSHRAIYAQLIDDTIGRTLAYASSAELVKDGRGKTKVQAAEMTGELLAKRARQQGITGAVFDRRHYAYHGRVKALADGARRGGLKI